MFDGEGSEDRPEPHVPCPACKTKPTRFTGSSVLHGNPFSPAADTEVEHYYRCPKCEHRWSHLA